MKSDIKRPVFEGLLDRYNDDLPYSVESAFAYPQVLYILSASYDVRDRFRDNFVKLKLWQPRYNWAQKFNFGGAEDSEF